MVVVIIIIIITIIIVVVLVIIIVIIIIINIPQTSTNVQPKMAVVSTSARTTSAPTPASVQTDSQGHLSMEPNVKVIWNHELMNELHDGEDDDDDDDDD